MENSSMIKIGPVGAPDSGNTWDDKGEIVQIFVSHDTKIHSLQFQYVHQDNGKLVLSDTHGQNTGDNFHVVQLNHPSEYIIYISGNYGKIGFYKYCLTSITFGTNLGTHGPFGEPSRSDHKGFTLHLGSRRQFGGFHGTSDTFVRSIGMYVKLKPISKLKEKDVPKRP